MLRPVVLTLLLSGAAFAAAPVDPPLAEEGAASSSTVSLSNEQFGVLTFGLSIVLFSVGCILGERLATL